MYDFQYRPNIPKINDKEIDNFLAILFKDFLAGIDSGPKIFCSVGLGGNFKGRQTLIISGKVIGYDKVRV